MTFFPSKAFCLFVFIISHILHVHSQALDSAFKYSVELLNGNIQKSRAVLERGLNEAVKNGNTEGQGRCYFVLGKLEQKAEQFELAISHYNKSMMLYQKANLVPQQLDIYSDLTNIYINKGNAEKGIELAMKKRNWLKALEIKKIWPRHIIPCTWLTEETLQWAYRIF